MSINHNWLLWRAVKLGVFHILFITGLVSIFEIKAVVFKRSILYYNTKLYAQMALQSRKNKTMVVIIK